MHIYMQECPSFLILLPERMFNSLPKSLFFLKKKECFNCSNTIVSPTLPVNITKTSF